MKKPLIAVLALILLLSCGAGAYFYMGKSEASTGEAPPKEESKAEGEAVKIAYVTVPTITLPIVGRDGSITQTISLVVSLQVHDEAKAKEIEERVPQLADAFLSDMYGTLSQKASMENGVIKVSTLKARLVEITHKVLGDDAVEGVLLQVLQQHPG